MDKLIHKLKNHKVQLIVKEGQLKLIVPENVNHEINHLIPEIKENKEALIAYLTTAKQSQEEKIELVPLSIMKNGYETSASQKEGLYGYAFSKNRGSFNMNHDYLIENLDESALIKTLVSLIKRYEVFRTTLYLEEGIVKQRVNSYSDKWLNLRIVTRKKDENVLTLINSLFSEIDNDHDPIDEDVGPELDLKMKLRLVKVDDTKHVLLISMMHIISDAWSLDIIEKELMQLYQSYSKGEANNLKPISTHFKDYIDWVSRTLKSSRGQAMKKYWEKIFNMLPENDLIKLYGINKYKFDSYENMLRNQLKEVYKPLTFEQEGHFLGVVPLVKYDPGKTYNYIIDQQMVAAMSRLTNKGMAIVIIAGYCALLAKMLKRKNVYLGLTVMQRNHEGVSKMIGNLTNTILIYTEVQPEFSFLDLIEDVNSRFNEAYENHLYPFTNLLREFDKPVQNLGTAFLNIKTKKSEEKRPNSIETGHSKEVSYSQFGLYLEITQYLDGIETRCDYNTSRYAPEFIERFFSVYENILKLLIESPEKPIKELFDKLDVLDKQNLAETID